MAFIKFRKVTLESPQTIADWLDTNAYDHNTRYTFYNTSNEIVGEYIGNKPVSKEYVLKETEIAGVGINDGITKKDLTEALQIATDSLSGIMSAADHAKLTSLYAIFDTNEKEYVDTLIEILEIFESYPESTNLITLIGGKVDKEEGKGLSTNDFTTAEKTKLSGIAAGAQVNVATNLAQGTRTTTQVPITSSTGTSATLTAATTTLAGVMTATDKVKLDGIAAGAQANVLEGIQLNGTDITPSSKKVNVQVTKNTVGLGNVDNTSDAAKPISTATQAALNIKANKTELFSGSYNDLTNKPTIPTKTSQLTNDSSLATETYVDNAIANVEVDLSDYAKITALPTKVSDLTNDSGFATETYVNNKVASVYKYKGSVAAFANLPTTNRNVGDVYDVKDTGMNYAWNGTEWDALGTTVDLSNYATKTELTSGLSGKVDKVAGKQLSTEDFITAEKTKLSGIAANAQVNVLEGVQLNGTDVAISSKKSNIVVNKTTVGLSNVPNVDTTNPANITQSDTHRFVSDNEKSTWNNKQNTLVSGTNIKTVGGESILGSGDIPLPSSEIDVQTWNTATKTLVLNDAGRLYRCLHSTDQTLTIPANANDPFPIGTMITFVLVGNNKVTFVAESGVTLTSMNNSVELKTQYAMASVIKTDTDTWQLVGALE